MRRLLWRADAATWVGVLGATLILSEILVHLPAAVYGGNWDELGFGLAAYALTGLAVVLPLVTGVAIGLRLLNVRARSAVAAALAGSAIVVWLYGNILLGPSPALDGRGQAFTSITPLGYWEIVAAVAAVIVLALAAVRYRRFAVVVLAMLNFGALGATAWELARDPRLHDPFSTEYVGPVFRFSAHGNVMVILLDGMQSDIFDHVATSDPDLAAVFDGFTLYRNAVGAAPTTLLSVPAIHSGLQYEPGSSIRAFYQKGVEQGSYINGLAAAGFQTSVVNPIKVCPSAAAVCTSAALAGGERGVEFGRSLLLLVDFALFRVAPFALKADIYGDNRWLLSRLLTDDHAAQGIIVSNAFLEQLAAQSWVDDGPPTAKFFHLFNTHAPFLLHEDCRTLSEESDPANIEHQVRCGLMSLKRMLEGMKRARAYDATSIILISDHGYASSSSYVTARIRAEPWTQLAGAANPTFAIKPARAHGALSTSDVPVSLIDVGATACALAGVSCKLHAGSDARTAHDDRSRSFLWYAWENRWWHRDRLSASDLTRYDVQGPVWDQSSWHFSGGQTAPYTPGTQLSFVASAPRPRLPPFEWSGAESIGTWSEGHLARLVLDLDRPPAGDLELVADAYGAVPDARFMQHVYVLANQMQVAQWTFDAAHTSGVRTARIPRALVSGTRLEIAFVLPDALSPLALGLSADARVLGIGLRSLRLQLHGPHATERTAWAPQDASLPVRRVQQ